MSYTSTYDAGHKVKRGGSHVKGYLRHIGRGADLDAGVKFPHLNKRIDPLRTKLNVVRVNDGKGGFRQPVAVGGKPPSAEMEEYLNERLGTVKRKLRKDAVVIRGVLLQLDPKWFEEHDPNWREAGITDEETQRYIDEQLAWLCDEVGQSNVVGYSLDLDETNPHLQVAVTPITDDGRLSQKEIFDYGRQRKALNERLEAAGYDVRHQPTERSKEHLSSAEFQAAADRAKESLEGAVALEAEAANTAATAKAFRTDAAAEYEAAARARAEAEGELELARAARSSARSQGLEEGRAEARGELEAQMALYARQRAQEREEHQRSIEEVRGALRATSELLDRLEADYDRVHQVPPSVDAFLDHPMKDGQTLRPAYERFTSKAREGQQRKVSQHRLDLNKIAGQQTTPGGLKLRGAGSEDRLPDDHGLQR